MTNLNSLKKEVKNLKSKRETSNKKNGFDILDKYKDGVLTFEKAMEVLQDDDYIWGGVVRLILKSGHYDDDTKRKMMNR